ncbi:MAG: tetratricopeptide repeat protein [Enhydrobacter sp.]|nr:MAG: tetratricopeptide repeat protein [Enhydrobacter sp.]
MAQDGQGLEVSNAGRAAIASLDLLRDEWLSFGGRFDDFVAVASREENCAMLPVMAANLLLSTYSRDGQRDAERHLARARAFSTHGLTAREHAWLSATEAWLTGDTHVGQSILEKVVEEWPRDLLAARLGQMHSFNRGDTKAMLRIGERALQPNLHNHHAWSMYAFALAEAHRLDEAERSARKAIEIERRSPCAHLVVAHCLGARGRPLDGLAFLHSMADTWEGRHSFIFTRNWWHLALFLIDLDRTTDALDLFDKRVWGVRKEFCEDQINAISLLARLELHGVDVGGRWCDVATYLKQRLDEHLSPFLDLHYLHGLARAGEYGAVTEMLANLEDRAERAKPHERTAWADCAVPAAHGLAAHAKGDHAAAANLFGRALPHLPSIGGSVAQRALFGALHVDSLIRAGWNDRALALIEADDRERPGVPGTKRALGALLRKLGHSEQAMAAEYQAEQLSRQYAAAKEKGA